jgi:hypothetical protein
VAHGIPKGETYEEALQALEDCFGDQHFAAAYRSQLKARTQWVGESWQEFATTIEHRAYPTLPEDNIRREAGKAFAEGVQDPDIKIQLLLGEKTVNEALRQALELQAVLLAVRPHKTSTKTFWGCRSPPTRRMDARRSGSLNGDQVTAEADRRGDQPSGNERGPTEKGERQRIH